MDTLRTFLRSVLIFVFIWWRTCVLVMPKRCTVNPLKTVILLCSFTSVLAETVRYEKIMKINRCPPPDSSEEALERFSVDSVRVSTAYADRTQLVLSYLINFFFSLFPRPRPPPFGCPPKSLTAFINKWQYAFVSNRPTQAHYHARTDVWRARKINTSGLAGGLAGAGRKRRPGDSTVLVQTPDNTLI